MLPGEIFKENQGWRLEYILVGYKLLRLVIELRINEVTVTVAATKVLVLTGLPEAVRFSWSQF